MRRSLLTIALLSLAACQTIHGDPKSAALSFPTAAQTAPRYQIQPGDIVETHFSDPSLNEQILIAPDGRINVAPSQDILAAGMTLPTLRTEVKNSAKIIDASFDVVLRSSVGVRVYVTGEVTTPGEIVVNGQLSALQAVARAGGLKLSAQGGEIILIRHDPSQAGPQVYSIDLDAAQNGANPAEDVLLQPYDILYVPRDRFGNFSLVLERIRQAVPVVFSLVYTTGGGIF